MGVLRKTLLQVVLAGCPIARQAFTREGDESGGRSSHQYDAELSSLDVSKNHAGGRTGLFPWNLGGWYVANLYCEQTDVSRVPIHYITTATMPSPNQRANRFRLDEHLDMEVQVWAAGGYKKYVQTSSTSVSNRNGNNSCKRRKDYTRTTNIESGSRGKVTFIVTKSIISGVNITSQLLVKAVGCMGSAGPTPTTAISRVVIKPGLITILDKCTFNRGDKISIGFGDLPGSAARLNDANYSKSTPIHTAREGGNFDQGVLNINLGIQTTTASGTAGSNGNLPGMLSGGQRHNDLGIMLKGESDDAVMSNQFYNVKGFYQNQGGRSLTVASVAKPGMGSVKEGKSEVSATVVAQFQQGDVMRLSALFATSMLLLDGIAQTDTKLAGNNMYFHGTVRALAYSPAPGGDKIEVDLKQIATQDLYFLGCSKPEKFSIRLRDCNPEVFHGILVIFSGREDAELTDRLALDDSGRGDTSGVGIGMSEEDGTAIRLDESTSIKEITEDSMTLNFLAWIAAEPSAIKNQSLEYSPFSTSGTWTLNYQ